VSVDIANESGTEVDEVALAGVARHVLDEMHIHPLAELSVLLVDEKVMADLHERWMGEPGPTDVLAFPMDELRPPGPPQAAASRADRTGAEGEDPGPALLGDVVLCPQAAAAQAREAGHSTADELELLVTHGLLHLLGYDHADEEERAAMFGLQDRLLASWRATRGTAGRAAAAAGKPARSRKAARDKPGAAGAEGRRDPAPAGTERGTDRERRKGSG
jgi:probable rRNA maturation factor